MHGTISHFVGGEAHVADVCRLEPCSFATVRHLGSASPSRQCSTDPSSRLPEFLSIFSKYLLHSRHLKTRRTGPDYSADVS